MKLTDLKYALLTALVLSPFVAGAQELETKLFCQPIGAQAVAETSPILVYKDASSGALTVRALDGEKEALEKRSSNGASFYRSASFMISDDLSSAQSTVTNVNYACAKPTLSKVEGEYMALKTKPKPVLKHKPVHSSLRKKHGLRHKPRPSSWGYDEEPVRSVRSYGYRDPREPRYVRTYGYREPREPRYVRTYGYREEPEPRYVRSYGYSVPKHHVKPVVKPGHKPVAHKPVAHKPVRRAHPSSYGY